jgi:hypothetical protein
MKYVANPVEVQAYRILEIEGAESRDLDKTPIFHLVVGDGESENQRKTATSEMTSRMTPKVGDYWVIQADGYVYLNPKDIFERKYRKA